MRQLPLVACVLTLALYTTDLAVGDDDAPDLTSEPSLDASPAALPLTSPNATQAAVRPMPRPGAAPRVQFAPPADVQMTNQTRQALAFYGGYSARATLSQLPRRTPVRSVLSQPPERQSKPFQAVEAEPTLSPYLNLDREETAEDVPNYFTFVRPDIQQRETNVSQHRALQRLQRQLNTVSATVVAPQYGAATAPGTGAPARFMDTAQFYGSGRR